MLTAHIHKDGNKLAETSIVEDSLEEVLVMVELFILKQGAYVTFVQPPNPTVETTEYVIETSAGDYVVYVK